MAKPYYTTSRVSRLIGAALRLAVPGVSIDTYGERGIVTLAGGQRFSFTVARLTPEAAASLLREWETADSAAEGKK
jgi:hypothetical protein